MFGRGSRGSPFDGFFGSDDPFTRDPFRQMDRMVEDFFGGGGLFARHPFDDPFQRREPPREEPRALPGQGATIRELDDEEHAAHGGGGHHPHHIEEPDDNAGARGHAGEAPRRGQQGAAGRGDLGSRDLNGDVFGGGPVTRRGGGPFGALGGLFGGFGGFGGFGRRHGDDDIDLSSGFGDGSNGDGGGASAYSYSSSSWSRAGGADGTVFHHTTTERVGPGGVRERQETVRDGRTGKETITLSRHIGDRGVTRTETRGADGTGDARNMLHNLDGDEAAHFDREWLSHAERGLYDAGPRGRRVPIAGSDADVKPPEPQLRIEEVGIDEEAKAEGARGRNRRRLTDRWV